MNSKYRTYDYSTNIILNSKITTYGPYKSLKQKNTSNKKIQPLHIKIFDKPKKNPKILSRNDRMDLFLEGGNFSQTRQVTSKSQADRSFYKIGRIKKKDQIFSPLRSQARTNGWQGSNYNNSSKNQSTKFMKSDYLNFINTADQSRKQSQINSQLVQENNNIIHQKSVQNVIIKVNDFSTKRIRKISRQRERTQNNITNPAPPCNPPSNPSQSQAPTTSSQNPIYPSNSHTSPSPKRFVSPQRSQQLKLSLKPLQSRNAHQPPSNPLSSSENQLQSQTQKSKRPLFYLESKQFSHIKADSFLISEYPSGQIIFGNNFKKGGEIASLTKIMTFYTVWQIGEKFGKKLGEENVEIDEEAQGMTGTSAEIFVGDVYTIQQLLYGLMLPSGNDAAVALGKWGGKVLEAEDPAYKNQNNQAKTFIKYMNVMAKSCGMKITKFCNPHGLPHPQSTSNAEDLACLMSQCLKINLFRQVIKTKKYSCWVEHKGTKHEVIWQNTNKLLRRPNFIGGKTGVTITAGPCLVSCYQLGQKIYIIIVLRTTKLSRRFKQTRFVLALALSKIDKAQYKQKIREILKNDAELDSDNSDDEEEFNYERNDGKEMSKRNKILTFQM